MGWCRKTTARLARRAWDPAPILLKQENLIVAGKSVETKHGNGQDRATADRIAQRVKSWSIQARAAEPLVLEDMILVDLVAVGCDPGLQRGQLTVDGFKKSTADLYKQPLNLVLFDRCSSRNWGCA
jgi:hypothetical protein